MGTPVTMTYVAGSVSSDMIKFIGRNSKSTVTATPDGYIVRRWMTIFLPICTSSKISWWIFFTANDLSDVISVDMNATNDGLLHKRSAEVFAHTKRVSSC
mmetsp:Transcript_60302/g.126202  ORF Transcript_60302/g.126202 Transcript_60302/m.126202 type:complete len:100 (-) Transcript_60302:147-446(-)